MNLKNTVIALVATVSVLGFAGCSNGPTSITNDQTQTNNQLSQYQKVQPVPFNDWSQYRQTLIDVEQAQVHGTATTTFMMNYGSNKPMTSCPSIGFPLPSTAQLTNPDQVNYNDNSGGNVVISQAESNGIYTGNSSGTYIVCVSNKGLKYITYWEGDTYTVGGSAHWDSATNQIVLDGDPTVAVKTKK